MIDMNKEIIFRDGHTLDGGPVTDYIAACSFDIIIRGYSFGLKLEQFFYDSDMIYYEWRGTKKDVMDWYTYVSTNMSREPEEVRNKTLEIIRNK